MQKMDEFCARFFNDVIDGHGEIEDLLQEVSHLKNLLIVS